ncbi:hypothetical protein RJT34_11191 [Clitoria ternatea]|uniref:Uncharacterized protein n=1 Tax=Clitoria ternatea TaxID=43366 RepID=A0AAN9PJC9_CLITE
MLWLLDYMNLSHLLLSFLYLVQSSNLMFVEVGSLGWLLLLLLYHVQNIHFVTIVFSWDTIHSAACY